MKKCFTPYVIASNTCSERSVGTKVARQPQSGFTLMELLVYMMIVGIIVVVAGQAFSNSTKFRVRTQNMLKATQEAENVATLFKADVSQMGAKSSLEGGTSVKGADYGLKFFSVCKGDETENCIPKNVYVNPDAATASSKDSSSFELTTSNNQSDLKVRRVRFDEDGKYKSVEEIHWFVNGTTLYRSCYTLAGEANSEGDGSNKVDICKTKPATIENEVNDAVEIATGVTEFNISAGTPSTNISNEQIFPTPCSPEPCTDAFQLMTLPSEENIVALKVGSDELGYAGGSSVMLSRFFSNFSITSGEGGELLDKDDWKINQVVAVNNIAPTLPLSWKNHCASHGIKALGDGDDETDSDADYSLLKDQEYEISFEIIYPSKDGNGEEDKSLMFVPGEDHMSVGLRNATNGDYLKKDGKVLLEDFMFYPPMNAHGAGTRSMRFTISSSTKEPVCITFTFACFSPLISNGKVTIKDLKLKKIASSNYDFLSGYNPESSKNDKKNIKALKLHLQISRGGKGGAGSKGETGEVDIVIPTPGNGPRD